MHSIQALITVLEQSTEVCRRGNAHRPVQFGQYTLSIYLATAVGIKQSKFFTLWNSWSWREYITQSSMLMTRQLCLKLMVCIGQPSRLPRALFTYIVLNSLIRFSSLQMEKQYFIPLHFIILTTQYVKCFATDLEWSLTGKNPILALLYTCGVWRKCLNLFEP